MYEQDEQDEQPSDLQRMTLEEFEYRFQHDYEFQYRFIYGHELSATDTIEQFQLDQLARFRSNKKQTADAIPRAHGKSTIAKIAVTLEILSGRAAYCLYMSNTEPVAAGFTNAIMQLLEGPNVAKVFGSVLYTTKQEAKGTFAFTIAGRKCRLEAAGAMGQVRGRNKGNERPDLLIYDDVENADIAESEADSARMRRWFFGTVMGAENAKYGRHRYIGNLINHRSLLGYLLKDPEWDSTRYGAITHDLKPLWPSMFSVDKLLRNYAMNKRNGVGNRWLAEWLNLPQDETSTFDIDKFKLLPLDPEYDCAVCLVDPAQGIEGRDETALVVYGRVNGEWGIIDILAGYFDSGATYEQMKRLSLQYKIKLFGYEAVQFQAEMVKVYEGYLKRDGMADVKVVPIMTRGKAKAARIGLFLAALADKSYFLSPRASLLLAQLQAWSPEMKAPRDDILDAASMIISLQQTEEFLALSNREWQAVLNHKKELNPYNEVGF